MTTYVAVDPLASVARDVLVYTDGIAAPTSLVVITTGISVTYDADLGRVRIAVGSLAAATYAVVDRTINGTTYTTIRGGAAVDVTSGALLVYDYEFPTTGAITYRVRTYS